MPTYNVACFITLKSIEDTHITFCSGGHQLVMNIFLSINLIGTC